MGLPHADIEHLFAEKYTYANVIARCRSIPNRLCLLLGGEIWHYSCIDTKGCDSARWTVLDYQPFHSEVVVRSLRNCEVRIGKLLQK